MNIKSVITFALITLGVLVGVTVLLWNFGAQPKEIKQITDIAGEMKNKKSASDEQNKVVVVEFSDFQCPACKSIQEPLSKVLAKFEGKITFVYRHFPLTSIHKNAMVAAYASEAASLQGKFWEMHDMLFTRQGEWEGLSDPREKYGAYATELGMDVTKFLADIESSTVKEAVNLDSVAAAKYNLSGTPSFFVNGYETDFSNLESKIQELLN